MFGWLKHPSGRVLTRRGFEPEQPARKTLSKADVRRALRELRLEVTPGFLRLVRQGALVELEHTPDPLVAVQIALDHLAERLDYYDRLKRVEQGP